MIKFDKSSTGIVVTCTECAYWYAFTFTQEAAYTSGEGHQIRVHDMEPARAGRPGELWKKRHAVTG